MIQDIPRTSSDSVYIALLEGVNTQLGLANDVLGMFVGALGVLFTAGAVLVTFLLFRQSREYRQQHAAALNQYKQEHEKAIADYKVVLGAFITEAQRELGVRIDSTLATHKQHLEGSDGGATRSNRKCNFKAGRVSRQANSAPLQRH